MSNGHGGAREGAGRKPNSEVFASEIAAAKRRIADRLPDLIDAQFDLALGVTVQEVDRETGGLMVYTRPPDGKAGQYLIDRILGKPVQATEISGPDGGPLLVEPLSDEERARRVAELLERARQGGAGLSPDGEPGDAA